MSAAVEKRRMVSASIALGRRRWPRGLRALVSGLPLSLAVAAICVAAGVFAYSRAATEFTATADIVVNPYRNQVSLEEANTASKLVDDAVMGTNIELARSQAVIELALPSMTDACVAEVRQAAAGEARAEGLPVKEAVADRTIDGGLVAEISDRLSIGRTPETQILEITGEAATPACAADLANAIAGAFIDLLVQTRETRLDRIAAMRSAGAAALEQQAAAAGQSMLRLKTFDPASLADRAVTRAATTSAFSSLATRSLETTESSSAWRDPRIVSLAVPPETKSAPRARLYVGGALLVGMIAGVLAALARERMKRTFSSTRQLDEVCGRCIAVRRRRPWRSRRNRLADAAVLGEVLLRFLRPGPPAPVGLVCFDGSADVATLAERMARSVVDSQAFGSVQVLAISGDRARLHEVGDGEARGPAAESISIGAIRGRSTTALGVDASAPCIAAVDSRSAGLLADWISEFDRFALVVTRRTSRADVQDLLDLPHVRARLVGAILV